MMGESMYNCMDKGAIRDFFDRLASSWDEQLIVDEAKMGTILDAAEINSGSRVLDVACGTGVMVDFYLAREVSQVTGIDLSPEMARICRDKYRDDKRVEILCGDAELYDFNDERDAVMVFNAFPHFPDPEGLIEHLSRFVRCGGTLTVAHDMGRKKLDDHHSGTASAVSHGMMHEDDIAELFGDAFDIAVKVSTPDLFIVTGRRCR